MTYYGYQIEKGEVLMCAKNRNKTIIISIIILFVTILFFTRNNVIIPKDEQSFNDKILEVVSNNEVIEDTQNTYQTKTLIIKSEKDLDMKNAKDIVKYKDMYVVTFETEEDTEKAYNEIQNNKDAVMEVSSTDITKQEIEEFLETCNYTNNDEETAELLDNFDVTNPYNYKEKETNVL